MTAFVSLGDVGFFAGGFALCWFFKLPIQKLVLDANTLASKLHAQANAISATVTTTVKKL